MLTNTLMVHAWENKDVVGSETQSEYTILFIGDLASYICVVCNNLSVNFSWQTFSLLLQV